MELSVSIVKELAEQLTVKQSHINVDDVIQKLFQEVSVDNSFGPLDPQMEDIAIQLWNWAVTKREGPEITEHQRAKVRHVACKLVHSCGQENPSENSIRKQILMASKTGRTWLDCKNPKLADVFLGLAVKSLETLYSRLISRGDGASDINMPKADVEKDLLRVLSYQAESAVAQERHQEAVACMQRCREMLQRLPKETGYLSLMCYNFGVDSYNQKKYEESSFWLSQSYDIGKMNAKYSPGSEVQAKVLRLLATVYVEWDCQQFKEKALSAISLANKDCSSPSGLYLKIRILLRSGAPDEQLRGGLTELMESEVTLEVCLSGVRLLMGEDREQLAFDFLKKVCERFMSSPELGSALVLHIELLLQRGKELLAKQKIEDVITGHYTGQPLTPQTLTTLHLLLWDRAFKHFEAKNYTEALQWYDYSLSFYKRGQLDPNLAKLQRNRTSCFLNLQQLEKAKEAATEATRCDPNSIFSHFSIYKIAILENNVDKATQAVQEIGLLAQAPVSSEERVLLKESAAATLLSLAAQMALESEQQETAIKALESLCEHSQDVTQVLTALRCLVRLLLSTMENTTEERRNCSLDMLLSYLKMAQQRVSTLSTGTQRTDEAHWFRRIAWNCALQCESAPIRMKDFFAMSYQLSLLCPVDKGMLMAQKTCLLMAAAAALELCRTTPHSPQQPELLAEVLEHIQICWNAWNALKPSGDFSKDPTEALLLLYEFEARAKLNDPKLDTVLESVLELENVDSKILETIAARVWISLVRMAALAMEPPAHFPVLCKKALRIALSLHRKQPQADLARCSQCIHSLIELSLPRGVCEVEARVLEEVWGYYEEAQAIINSAPEDSTELEVLWLLTRAWNTGILLYSLAQYPEAEKWCGLGMSFLRHLGSLQESYQKQMSGLYSELLERLDKAKRNLIMEE
ncbi:testis-expressed protein 11 isoform X1 [Alosa alosa]|uniref:testis-expressed protein 11 isoform X1 n=1 Tax=Alosa alosa TaxID=278164 RepID=UPI0020153C0C|nr:testis-expressed protein 11 isoform X1 [Alosa alosa]